MSAKLKTLYCIGLDYDMGELWLNEKFEPIRFVHANDGYFDAGYYGWIFKHLGGRVVSIGYSPTDEEYDHINDAALCNEDMWPIIKTSVLKELKVAV